MGGIHTNCTSGHGNRGCGKFKSDWNELSVGIVVLVLEAVTVICNIACALLKIRYSSDYHKQGKVYFVNLTFSNLLRASFNIYMMTSYLDGNLAQIPSANLYYYIIISDYLDHLAFVALFSMLLDVAYYCKYSLDYNDKMTRTKVFGCIATGWLYVGIICSVGYAEQTLPNCSSLEIDQVMLRCLFIFEYLYIGAQDW